METKNSKIIEQLSRVITELDSRECSSNNAISEYRETDWDELCNIGAELFEHLKV